MRRFAMDSRLEHDSEGDLWVFGYGSLMWRPGFAFLESAPARLFGLHRALCVYSFVHRGTPEKPGLVLGLDRGGACRGVAFRIPGKTRVATIDYLRGREQVTKVYIETSRMITVLGTPERRVRALVYCVDRGHAQYAGELSVEQQLHIVCARGMGVPASIATTCCQPSRHSRRSVATIVICICSPNGSGAHIILTRLRSCPSA